MQTPFLFSTTRSVLRFQLRNELLLFRLKPHTIPSHDVLPSLVAFFDIDERLRAGVSEVRKVGADAVQYLERWVPNAESDCTGMATLS